MRLSFKGKRAYKKLLAGKGANFDSFSYAEKLEILNKAEENCIYAIEKIDKLIQQKELWEGNLQKVRDAKLQIKEG